MLTNSAAAYQLQTIAAICLTEPKTLAAGKELFRSIAEIATTLRGTPVAAIGETILEAVTPRADKPSPKTLPQVKDALRKIGALIPTTPNAALSTPSKSVAEPNADAAIYDGYLARTGPERMAFLSENRASLVREHTRRANAATQTVHASLIDEYTSLTGASRRAFFAAHERELFAAYKARNKH